jgi:amino acid permease
MGIWVAVFLVILSAIQFFGVRGYGEGKTSALVSSRLGTNSL